MPKKVLIMTQNFYPVIGSAGNRMKNIFQLLNEQGVESHVLTTEPAYPNKNMYRDNEFWDDEQLNNDTEKIFRVPIKHKNSKNILSRLFFYIEIMIRFLIVLVKLRKNKYDYILVSTPPIFIVFSAFIGKIILKSKLILEVRDLWPDSLLGVKAFDSKLIIGIFRWFEKKMYQKADAIVINSKGFLEHIKEKLERKDKPIIYLPNGPRNNELNPSMLRDIDVDFRVVYTGNLGLAQDIDRLKLTAKLLNDKEITFNVIGYGIKAKEFEEYIDQHNLKNVHFYKPTTRKKSLDLIKSSHVAIAFLNNEEVFTTVLPGKIVDYITCRTPVVAGVKGTAAKLIVDNDVGYAVESEDVREIIAKISDLKENRKRLAEMANHCENLVKEEFLWEENIKNLVNIIGK